CGIPVIATDVGGLRSYFSDDEITYVRPNDPRGMRATIDALMANDEAREAKAKRALDRMKNGDLNSTSFVARHVELSYDLLQAYRPGHASNTFSVAAQQ